MLGRRAALLAALLTALLAAYLENIKQRNKLLEMFFRFPLYGTRYYYALSLRKAHDAILLREHLN